MMKRLYLVLALWVSVALAGAAQQRQIYLFPDYQQGAIYVNGFHRPQQVSLNIDALGQRIYYFQGQTLMELTQLHRMDSLLVGGHTFVMHDGLLCERLALQKDTILVNWRFNKVNMGSAGAMGITTQNRVEVLWTNPNMDQPQGEGHYSSTGAFSPEIWQSRSANTYFFFVGGREWKARRLKDLYKAFPDQAAALKSFAKEHRYRMENAQQALQIITYLQELLRQP